MTRSSISFQYHHGRSRYQFVYNEHMAANIRKDVNYPRMQRAAIRKVVHGSEKFSQIFSWCLYHHADVTEKIISASKDILIGTLQAVS